MNYQSIATALLTISFGAIPAAKLSIPVLFAGVAALNSNNSYFGVCLVAVLTILGVIGLFLSAFKNNSGIVIILLALGLCSYLLLTIKIGLIPPDISKFISQPFSSVIFYGPGVVAVVHIGRYVLSVCRNHG